MSVVRVSWVWVAVLAVAATSTQVASAGVYWGDEFNSPGLNRALWDKMNFDEWGTGRVIVRRGVAHFRRDTSGHLHFPTIVTKTDPFPATGDWILECRMAWTTADGGAGNGFVVSEGLDDTGLPARAMQGWRDGGGLRLLGQGTEIFTESATSTAWHTYAMRKNGSTYTYYVDGALKSTEAKVRTPDTIVLGNAGGMSAGFGEMTVDFARTLAPGAPTLEWTRAAGYGTDGVHQDVGREGDRFMFKVRFVGFGSESPDGRPRLHLLRNGQEVAESPFSMTEDGGGLGGYGLVYRRGRNLKPGTYSHYFSATSAGVPVGGPASLTTAGPVVAGQPSLPSPRVSPATGSGSTTFRYRVGYRSTDGLPATWVMLQVRANVPGVGWQAMKLRKYNRPVGSTAVWNVALGDRFPTATAFRYRFQALRQVGPVSDLVKTDWIDGPTVGDGGVGVTLTSVAATATSAGGAEVTYTLSAPAAVEATVLNMAGRPVKRLTVGQVEAGRQRLLWSGRSDAGLAAPAGTYLVRLRARDAEGGQTQALVPVTLRR